MLLELLNMRKNITLMGTLTVVVLVSGTQLISKRFVSVLIHGAGAVPIGAAGVFIPWEELQRSGNSK